MDESIMGCQVLELGFAQHIDVSGATANMVDISRSPLVSRLVK
jgi:hypothetical protein